VSVVKIIELVGSSPVGWREATDNALKEAAKTIENIKSVHVKKCTAKVENNKIVEYRAVVKLAFVVKKERQFLLSKFSSGILFFFVAIDD